MKVKYGTIIVAGSGTINGFVAANNKAGSYLRTKVTPVNPQTIAQNAVRNAFTASSQAWRGLTVAQREAWNSSTGDFMGTDQFGDSRSLSGFQLFTRINNNLRFVGETVITTPPVPTAVAAFTDLSLAVVKGTDAVTVTFEPAIDAGDKVILSMTAGVSAGKSFVKSEYRKVDILTSAETSPHVATTEYETKFGDVPAIGRKVFVKLKTVNKATGLTGAVITGFDIVEASA